MRFVASWGGTVALRKITTTTSASGPGWYVTRYGALAVLRLRNYSGGDFTLPDGFTPAVDCTFREVYGDVNLRTTGSVTVPSVSIWDTFTYPVA